MVGRYTTEAEPRQLSPKYFEVLDQVASRIQPEDPTISQWFSNYRQQHRARLAADLWMIERHLATGAQVLDCGAVPLLATGALAQLGYAVKGVDIAPQRFRTAIDQLGLEVQPCDIEQEPLPFAQGTFDGVVFNELFEHLRINPIKTLREVHRVLKPAAKLFLSTPNLRSFRGIRNLLLRNEGHAASAGVYRQYEKLETLGHMGHVREYTTREVAEFLSRIGFQTEKIIYRGGYGRGVVGFAERLAPSFRPFFAIIATKISLPETDVPQGGRNAGGRNS